MTVLLLLALAAEPVPADGDRQTILFLGDSITFAGGYVDHFDAQLRLAAAHAGRDAPNVIQIGLSSETVCGMTEQGHPFPRPNVHSRLKSALERIEPDVVFACYGMNDGIYKPLDAERFACYQDGMRRLVRDVLASAAELVLLTPPPFDRTGRRIGRKPMVTAEQQAAGAIGIYEGYDEVLTKYAAFVASLPDEEEFREQPLSVIDLHAYLKRNLAGARKFNKAFTYAKDGIHPDQQGHRIMGLWISQLRGGAEPLKLADPRTKRAMTLIRERSTMLRDAWHAAIGHEHPRKPPGLPVERAEAKAAELDRQIAAIMADIANREPAAAF